MSVQTPAQHWLTGAVHAMPTSVDVPQTAFTHVATRHGPGAGQSATAPHDCTHAPLPSHTRPAPSLPHGTPAAAAVLPQQPATHVATTQGPEAAGQSLAWLHALVQVPPLLELDEPLELDETTDAPPNPPVPALVVKATEPPVLAKPLPLPGEPPVEELPAWTPTTTFCGHPPTVARTPPATAKPRIACLMAPSWPAGPRAFTGK